MLDVNTRATMSLLEGALASPVPLQALCAGQHLPEPTIPSSPAPVTFDENTPQKPIDIYALTKLLVRGDLLLHTCANTGCR